MRLRIAFALAIGGALLGCATARGPGGGADGEPDCVEQPPGKEVGLATADEPFVCIPSQPGNNDATCAPFADNLRGIAAMRAAATCVRVHRLTCRRRACDNECVPAARVTKSSLALSKNFPQCPNPQAEDACRLLAVVADCDCLCPVVGP